MLPKLIAAILSAVVVSPERASTEALNAKAKEVFDQAFGLSQQGHLIEALDLYEKALEQAPDSASIWLEYTACLRKAGYLQQAARAGWRTVELAPKESGGWGNLGNVFGQVQAWDAAMAAFQKAESFTPDPKQLIQSFLTLGFRQWSCGENELALRTYQYALRKDPENGLTLIDIGCLYATQGQLPLAREHITKGLALCKTRGDSGAAQYAEAALQELNRSQRLGPPPLREGFQRLPQRLLVQPPPGKALDLPIDPLVTRLFPHAKGRPLSIRVPSDWWERIEQTDPGLTIVLGPRKGFEFSFLWTPLPGDLTSEQLRTLAQQGGERLLPGAVEGRLELRAIRSASLQGFFYTLTDKSMVGKQASPQSYPFILQGSALAGGMLHTITVLSVRNDAKFRDEMLERIQSISLDPSTPAAAAAPRTAPTSTSALAGSSEPRPSPRP